MRIGAEQYERNSFACRKEQLRITMVSKQLKVFAHRKTAPGPTIVLLRYNKSMAWNLRHGLRFFLE
jgi:hypothetical protein